MTTVVATPGQGPDRPQEVSYTDIKVIGNGSFGVVYQARLIDSQEMVAIKKVLQDKRFKVCLNRSSGSAKYSEGLKKKALNKNVELVAGILRESWSLVLCLLKRLNPAGQLM